MVVVVVGGGSDSGSNGGGYGTLEVIFEFFMTKVEQIWCRH